MQDFSNTRRTQLRVPEGFHECSKIGPKNRKNGTKKCFGNLRMKILVIRTMCLAHGGDEQDLIPISLDLVLR
nr:hypothetical protein CFP56_28067 [Quercus suber]